MPGFSDLSISRRRFLQVVAASGVVAACTPSSNNSAAPAGSPAGSSGAGSSGAAASGTVTVSYPDEAGFKPKYVEQAAAAAKANGVDVKIELEKIGDDVYYPKLLLRLDSNDVPDVFHFGGGSIGELADAGYIEPLDSYIAQWADWSQYPDAVKSGSPS